MGCRVFPAPLEKLKPSGLLPALFSRGLYFLISGILQFLYSRTLKNERITNAPAGERYVLRSWVTAGSLDAGGRYRDRNFGELPDYPRRSGKGGLDHSSLFQPGSKPFRPDEADVPERVRFILPSSTFRLRTSSRPCGTGCGPFSRISGTVSSRDEIRPLVREIHRSVSLHPSYLSYNSIRYLLERLARRNVRIDCFIYPAGKQSARRSRLSWPFGSITPRRG